MKLSYNYLFHFSEFRDKSVAWACVHRDDLNYYFNGEEPFGLNSTIKIGYGKTPEESFYNATKSE